MASLTIYLDEETLRAVERAAKDEGASISAWARKHLAEASREEPGWPKGYFETIEAFGGTEIEEPPEVDVPLDEVVLNRETR